MSNGLQEQIRGEFKVKSIMKRPIKPSGISSWWLVSTWLSYMLRCQFKITLVVLNSGHRPLPIAYPWIRARHVALHLSSSPCPLYLINPRPTFVLITILYRGGGGARGDGARGCACGSSGERRRRSHHLSNDLFAIWHCATNKTGIKDFRGLMILKS